MPTNSHSGASCLMGRWVRYFPGIGVWPPGTSLMPQQGGLCRESSAVEEFGTAPDFALATPSSADENAGGRPPRRPRLCRCRCWSVFCEMVRDAASAQVGAEAAGTVGLVRDDL